VTRPEFHFTAAAGWINDPHAITFRDGRYHRFYQYVPDSLVWAANCHWGHAVGTDLFTFEPLPVALAPGEGDDGIWTGSLVTDSAGASTIFYTSVVQPGIGIGRVRTATPNDDDWITWTKGPVIAEPPSGLDIVAYRDPFVFRDGGHWTMFVGAGLADGTAAALSYRSADLTTWSYEGVAAHRSTRETDPVWSGALWECPQLFELDGRHVMVTSVWDADVLHYTAYAIGDYRDGKFVAETWGRLSYGPSYYAPSFFPDAEGRSSLIFWLRGVNDPDAGWASAHSLPYTLSLEGDHLLAVPQDGLDAYRGAPAESGRVAGGAADAVWTPVPASAGTLLVVADGEVVADIWVGEGRLVLSRGGDSWEMPYTGGDVRVVVDGPIVEASTPDGLIACPIDAATGGVQLTAEGRVRVWPLERRPVS
jgi:beta-fructofuranosidase